MATIDTLINPKTGEIDGLAVIKLAKLRAAIDWGGPNFPPAYYRNALRWCKDRAEAMRAGWRRDHGLPDDSETVMVAVPTWGQSGDGWAA